MSESAWRGLNGPVRIAAVCPPARPVLETDELLAGEEKDVVLARADRYDWPQVELRQERRARRVVRREIDGGMPLRPTPDLLASPVTVRPAMPLPPPPYATGNPMEVPGCSLLEMKTSSDPTAHIELAPVLRRLTVWSPLPPGNHGCEVHRETAHILPPPLLEPELEYDPSPVEPEEGRPVVEGTLPGAFSAAVPERVRSKTVASGYTPQRDEPQVRILGTVIRFEFPSLA